MHEENLDILRNEASRLIKLERSLLESIQKTPGLLTEDGEIKQSFDEKSLVSELEVLSGESHKLESMDMVVAVVGTMKAGKSTTINAIVGSEILPNRNGPMTSIPTLIRHVEGKKTPSVNLNNNGPLNDLCRSLFDVIAQQEIIVSRLCDDSEDMADVIRFIQNKEGINKFYEGRQGIFDFLKIVNDLVRICRELDYEFPFSDYDEMHELPVIEVEFTSLSKEESGLGSLTLLDTPGPNEAGQTHLKTMLRDQLRKASAVIAVLNYTQLKSESDEDLRNEVNAIANIAKGRMYALVNKFDQRSYNDPDEAAVKKMVGNLLAGNIPEESIFAVSAQQAFLGEVVQKFIRENGSLPDPDEHPWVEEFARDCFGRRWESHLNDADRVIEEAQGYWKDSGFAQPLEKIIHTAYQNAAYYALDATAAKLASLAEKLSNFVNGRETALQKTTDDLQKYISDLKGDVDHVSSLREVKEKRSRDLFRELNGSVESFLLEAIGNAVESVNQLFEKGVIEQEKRERALVETTAKDRDAHAKGSTRSQRKRNFSIGDLVNEFVSPSAKNNDEATKVKQLDVSKEEIEFSNRSEANDFVLDFDKALEPAFVSLNDKVSFAVDKAVEELDQKLRVDVVREAEEILNSIGNRLGKEGFNLYMKLPGGLQASGLDLGGFSMKDGVSENTKRVTRLREQRSGWGGVKRFFGGIVNTDWGYDEVEEEINVYKVSLKELQKKTKIVIHEQGKIWSNEVEKEVREPISKALAGFFDELERKVEDLRGDLMQGINDQLKNKKEKEELMNGLEKISKYLPSVMEDTEGLQDEARQSLGERQL